MTNVYFILIFVKTINCTVITLEKKNNLSFVKEKKQFVLSD